MIIPQLYESEGNIQKAYDPFSRLLKDRIVYLSGEVTQESADAICALLLFLDSQNNKPIKLYINSPGGSVLAGLAIYDVIKLIKSEVSTVGLGLCASMGAFLLSAGAKGKRFATKHCEIMIHQPLIAGGIGGQISDIEIESKHAIKQKEQLTQLLADHSGKTLEEMYQLTDRNNWLMPEDAIEIGLIDSVI